MHFAGGQHIARNAATKGSSSCWPRHPGCQRRAIQINAFACINPTLAVQGQVIAVLRVRTCASSPGPPVYAACRTLRHACCVGYAAWYARRCSGNGRRDGFFLAEAAQAVLAQSHTCAVLAFGATRLQFFQLQLKLLDLALDLLRLASELHPLQLGDQQLQCSISWSRREVARPCGELFVFAMQLLLLERISAFNHPHPSCLDPAALCAPDHSEYA